jgi:hypothetical protein
MAAPSWSIGLLVFIVMVNLFFLSASVWPSLEREPEWLGVKENQLRFTYESEEGEISGVVVNKLPRHMRGPDFPPWLLPAMNLLFVGVILVFAKRSARAGLMDDSAAP